MSDDKTKTHPLDAKHIDIHDPSEVRNWCKALNCTEADLNRAVTAVGTSGQKVRNFLGR